MRRQRILTAVKHCFVPCLVQMGELTTKVRIAEVSGLDSMREFCHGATLSTARPLDVVPHVGGCRGGESGQVGFATLGLRVVGVTVFLGDAEGGEKVFEDIAAAAEAGG
jgi:hypothetical protein